MERVELVAGTPAHRCLALAWQAYGRRTVPVGAVLCGPAGETVSEGRSRMYEREAPPGELAWSPLAHAEVNALVKLDPEPRYGDHTLYTSLEPCLLCLGAAAMATIGTLVFLGPDPYGGAVGVFRPTRLLERAPVRFVGPLPPPAGTLAAALHVAFYLDRNPGGHTVGVHRRHAPEVVAAAERLVRAGVAGWAQDGVALPEVLAELLRITASG